ncbi:MAG: response regulator, partial [Ginsengibacter sp.]
INMPVMNGWEFLDAINQSPIADDILIAVVTSSTNESDKKRAFEYKQVIRYIEKPVNIQKLCELKQDKALKLFFTSEKR